MVNKQRIIQNGEWEVNTTGRGYTGHRENRDLGLTYMNARYYVSGIGRFASADTIVPDPVNPQVWNRYSYVLNSPIRLNDPTVHCAQDDEGGRITATQADIDCWNIVDYLVVEKGYEFDDIKDLNFSFGQEQKDAIPADRRSAHVNVESKVYGYSRLFFEDGRSILLNNDIAIEVFSSYWDSNEYVTDTGLYFYGDISALVDQLNAFEVLERDKMRANATATFEVIAGVGLYVTGTATVAFGLGCELPTMGACTAIVLGGLAQYTGGTGLILMALSEVQDAKRDIENASYDLQFLYSYLNPTATR